MASWQVDIPGLSQLVLNAGANGLKQLALSGVDIHTIGCMLMVSELIPVSQDFRRALNNSREKQRAERQWLYKVVEIGTGSFFLVDQFLKTRAGENVLALMASIVPLMSQDACVAVLGILFETAGASNDCTPGVSQLLRLREGLLLYVRNVGFQERVLQYHAILDRISTAGSLTTKAHGGGDPFDAIPAKHNVARIIQLCHKVATSTDNCVLTFSGLNGSGWLGAYATLILGLPVCALDSKGNHVPLNCSYGQAKVILNPSEESGVCKLLISGQLDDFISIDRMDASSRRGWSIDCKTINFLRLNHPEIENSQVHAVSEYAAVRTLKLVAHRVKCNGEHWQDHSFVPYFVAVLPQIQRRSLEVLTLLGFRVKDLEYYRSSHNCRSGGTYEDTQAKIAAFDFSGVSCPQCMDAAEYMGAIDDGPEVESLFKETLVRATCFASGLAFTDWSTKLQTMSAQYAYGRLDLQMKAECDGTDLCESIDPIVGLGQALSACTDVTDRKLSPPGDWLVVDLDGVVVLRTLATCQSIHMADGKFLSLLPGHVIFEEEIRSIVRMDDNGDVYSKPVKSTSPLVEPLNIALSGAAEHRPSFTKPHAL